MESQEVHSSPVYSSANVQENDSEGRLPGIGPNETKLTVPCIGILGNIRSRFIPPFNSPLFLFQQVLQVVTPAVVPQACRSL